MWNNNNNNNYNNSDWIRFMIVVFGLLEILIFSGTILGWTSLKLMLKNEGVYSYLCNDNQNNFNDSQIQQFNNSSQQNNGSDSTTIITDSTDLQLKNLNSTNSTTAELKNLIDMKIIPKLKKLNSNFTLKINLTLSDNQQNPFVIPFETDGIYDQNFIQQLLNDSSLILKSNSSDIKVNLISDPNKSTKFEEYLDLYLTENFQPLLPSLNPSAGCKQQEVTLNLAFSIGSFCMGAAAFIWGFLLEKLGLRIVRLIINGMFAIGAFILCFVQEGRDWLLFPSLLIMSLSGVPIRIANMQISNLYPSRRSTIISIYSGAFSASSIIYVILYYLYSNTQLNFFWVNFLLVILSLTTIPFTLFVLPKDRVREPPLMMTLKKAEIPPPPPPLKSPIVTYDKNHNVYSTSEAANVTNVELFSKKSTKIDAKSSIKLQNYKPIQSPNLSENRKNANGFINKAFIPDSNNQSTLDGDLTAAAKNSNEVSPTTNEIVDNQSKSSTPPPSSSKQSSPPPPLRLSLLTLAYNLHQLWFSWMITYMVMYVGSLDLWTKRVTEDSRIHSLYFNIYGMAQVLALIVSPIAGLLMDWQLAKAKKQTDPLIKRVKQYQSGFWPLFITSFTLLICVICHYFDREEFIYISIIFMTIYRSFLLAVGSAFLRIRFHPEHFNQLLGIMSSISAVISLLQIPLYSWEKNSESNVIYVNILNTVIALLVMSNSLYLLITPLQKYFVRKEEAKLKKYS